MMRSARLALAFFTALPAGETGAHAPGDLSRACAWLPAVGAVVGSALVLAGTLTASLPAPLSAALVLAAWLAVTGMLHLDGLLDSADALLAPVPLARRLEILADVHVGAFGFGVGVVALLTKWQALAATGPSLAWVAAPMAARIAAVAAMRIWPPAKPTGLGAGAAGVHPGPAAALGVALLLVEPLVAGIAVIAGLAVAAFAARRLGGAITGDVLGAAIEVAEIAGLIGAAALWEAA